MTDSFNITVRGERHVQENKVCQDYSVCTVDDDVAIAVVCDGHGSSAHFRSDAGARFAAEATVECVRQFVESTDVAQLATADVRVLAASSQAKDSPDEMAVREAFQPLLARIVCSWLERIKVDVEQHPFTAEEMAPIPEEYRHLYTDGYSTDGAYGTTLLAYVQCRDCWFSFQVGDGIIMFFNGDDCELPIADDPVCRDNLTTSLCDHSVLEEFRLTVGTRETMPSCAFACTDGLQKCFRGDQALADYLYKVSQILNVGGKSALGDRLASLLPTFSKITSGDDISLACIYNKEV